jgi:hypothetical protein
MSDYTISQDFLKDLFFKEVSKIPDADLIVNYFVLFLQNFFENRE